MSESSTTNATLDVCWASVLAADLAGMSEADFERVRTLRAVVRTMHTTRPLADFLASRNELLRTPITRPCCRCGKR